MKGIDLPTSKETTEFQKIIANVVPHLISTTNGPTLIALLPQNAKEVDKFIDGYCKKVETSYPNPNQATAVEEYIGSIKALRSYANAYPEVRDYLATLSNTLTLAKAEVEVVTKNPGFADKLSIEGAAKRARDN